MHRPVPSRLAWRWFAVLWLISCWDGVSDAQVSAHLVDYHAAVTFSSETRAAVAVTLDTAPANSIAKILLARARGTELTDIAVLQLGATIPHTVKQSFGALLIELPVLESPAPIEIRYVVASNDPLQRVPLPVISVPPLAQQRPVTVEANLPEGIVAIGEGFPALTWKNANHGEARSPAVPSFLILEMKPLGSITWSSHLLTPSGLSTLGMFVLLSAGSLVWYLRNRLGDASS